MRYIGFLTLLCIGFTFINISSADRLPWWGSLLFWAAGYIVIDRSIRADERHELGL